MPRTTKADLEREVDSLRPYEWAFFALHLRRQKPIKLKDQNPDRERRRKVEILDPGSPTGGVVIEGPMVRWAGDWCAAASRTCNPYVEDMVSQIHRIQREAWQAAS